MNVDSNDRSIDKRKRTHVEFYFKRSAKPFPNFSLSLSLSLSLLPLFLSLSRKRRPLNFSRVQGRRVYTIQSSSKIDVLSIDV